MATRIPTYRQAQLDIKQYIEKNGLRPGDALPTEDRLAELIGVSRLSLREAIKAMDSLGIVESRHGDGVYVKAFTFDAILENLPYAMAMTDMQVRNLLYTRAYLELGAIPDVVRFIQPANLARLRELTDAMLAHARLGEDFLEADRAFHVEMYSCLGNDFLNSMIDLFWKTFHQMIRNDRPRPADPLALEDIARSHLLIVEMLAQRDTFGLMSAHRRHFQQLFNKHPIQEAGAQPVG
ncbi:FadR/GntR family transcriptional regulator [Leptothrix discophora]|uniref:FCD domain-containing protein n=1 Tax=Leptothrix discophora TaxID=89 RepID=A0ABT9G2V5_LEPDI|nr:FCD domain-containing protein [Leptothrix discophora]MDP4300824.1 FCD domain-containing protein [Leptothrix discophora]